MQLNRVKRELNRFAKYVIKQARTNLTKKRRNVSKKLYNSLTYNINETPDATTLTFFMEEYGYYQDQGVSGKKQKYGTPFSFKSKMPPASAFSQWVIRKGIKGTRDKKGRFVADDPSTSENEAWTVKKKGKNWDAKPAPKKKKAKKKPAAKKKKAKKKK